MTWLVGISWLLIVIALILFISEYRKKTKRFDNWVSFLTIMAFIFLFVGIFTGDPFLSEYFPISLRFEILIEMLAGGWLIWKSYLNPLKERVINAEKDVSSIKTDVVNIKENIREKFNEIKNDVVKIKEDFNEVKSYIMKKAK